MKELINEFNTALLTNAYELFGSFYNGGSTVFRLWAPNAQSVSVVGDFNNWNADANYMERIEGGIWQTEINGLKNYDNYKYAIVRQDGSTVLKSDPYARHYETAPDNASKIYADDNYEWNDSEWVEAQKNKNIYASPVNIYEVHAGSWRMHDDGNFY